MTVRPYDRSPVPDVSGPEQAARRPLDGVAAGGSEVETCRYCHRVLCIWGERSFGAGVDVEFDYEPRTHDSDGFRPIRGTARCNRPLCRFRRWRRR